MPNAITILKEDHRRLQALLTRLDDTTERGAKLREKLVADIEMEVKIHAQLEEEIFYPAYKEAARSKEDKEVFFEATEEHHVVDMVLPALKAANPKSDEFGAKAKVLKDLIDHHIEEEENEMFAKARKLLSASELNEVGEAMAARKETLVAMWKNPVTRQIKKVQSAAHKFMPTKVKNVKATVAGKAMTAAKRSSAKKSGGNKGTGNRGR